MSPPIPTDLEIIAYEETPLGPICLRRRELLSRPGSFVTEITLNHEFLMSSRNTASERALSTRAIELHGGKALKVLVGGLGLGYTAREALKSDRVAALEVVEFIPEVIDWLRKGFFPLAPKLNNDSRFSVVQGDVYARLGAKTDKTFDLLLIDVDHSPEERLGKKDGSFYSVEGLHAAKKHLAPGGYLGVWSYAESPVFAENLRAVFKDVLIEPVTFENLVYEDDETNWLFFARD